MKKIFTMKRIIILMSMIFIYSFAFLFVKVYAEKTILGDKEPSDAALYVEAENEEPEEEKLPEPKEQAVSEAPAEEAETVHEPVEYISDKAAGRAIMGLAAATAVSDIEIVTQPETQITTAPTTTAAPETTAAPKTTATQKTTEAPKPVTTEQPTLDSDEEEDLDEESDEEEEIDEKENIIEEPEGDGGIYSKDLSPEEFRELLESLGISQPEASEPAPTNPADILVSGNSYKNQVLTIYDTKQKKMRTENAFDLVCEVTNYEVGDSMDPEAIKAQAVAVYTYIKYYEQKGEYAEIGTKSDVPKLVKDCVEAVDGLAIYYDGKYIMSAFSASTGGFSAASKNVWGGDLPYLQSVRNDYDYLDEKNYGRVTTYTVEEVRQKIESKTDIKLSDNYSDWIRILSYNDSIYAGQLSIDGHTSARISGKERTITGHIFRTYVLNIRSTAFDVSYSNGVFTFTTYGYGHGVGMSQIGADLYAKYGGYTYDQILHHYYTGVTIA